MESTVSLHPSKDNTLYQDNNGAFSNGAGAHFFAGKTGTSAIRRAVVAFDVAGEVPAGSTITSATLTLHMSRTNSETQTIELHKIEADWGEGTSKAPGRQGRGGRVASGDATWLHRFYDTDPWETVGGDFSSRITAGTSVSEIGPYSWGPSAQLADDVQSWLDDPASNFGWLLMGNEETRKTTKRFDSKENETSENRPVLTVTFSPP